MNAIHLITTAEAAERANVTVLTIANWTREGKVAVYNASPCGRRNLYSVDEIDTIIGHAKKREENRVKDLADIAKVRSEIDARRVSPCGTASAYNRHRRNGETPCDPCRKAMSAYQADVVRRRAEREGTTVQELYRQRNRIAYARKKLRAAKAEKDN